MASTDALPHPRKNAAYRLTFPIYKNDGTLIAGATGLDSEVSKDGGTFADATNEATEIATSSGVYYLDLTSTEMNADTVAVVVKSSSTGATPPVIVLYPQEAGDIRADVNSVNGSTAGASSLGKTSAAMKECTVTDTGFTPTTTQFEVGEITASATDHYVGSLVIFTSGTLADQRARVTASSLVSGRTRLTVTTLTSAPANGVTLVLV